MPFIVFDPRREADATRGIIDERFVESVDLVPTVLDMLGLPISSHRIEGRSLKALLEGARPDWREVVYSELDYGFREARRILAKTPQQSRAFSLRTARWRYVYWLDEPEQLWDLDAEPEQTRDLGRAASHEAVRDETRGALAAFLARRKHRVTMSDEFIERTNRHKQMEIPFGQW